jgi:hypothetical protein
MAGRPRKAPNALAGHRAGRAPLKLVPPSEPAPPAPAGLLPEVATIWVRYWTSATAVHGALRPRPRRQLNTVLSRACSRQGRPFRHSPCGRVAGFESK